MRTLLLAATALTIATAAQAKGFDVLVYAGPNFDSQISGSGSGEGGIIEFAPLVPSTTTLTGDPDVGYVLGLALSTPVDSLYGVSVGLDLNYRKNNFDGTFDTLYGDEVPPEPLPALLELPAFNSFHGQDTTWALLATARYDYPIGQGFGLFALGGMGIGERHLVMTPDYRGGPAMDATESGFVYELGAGASYEPAKGVKVGLQYLVFQAPVVERTVDLFPNPVNVSADGLNQSLVASVTVQFD